MQHPRHYISIIITFFNTWLFASNFVVKFKIYETRTRLGDTILYYYLNQRQLGTWNKLYVGVLKIDNSYYVFWKLFRIRRLDFTVLLSLLAVKLLELSKGLEGGERKVNPPTFFRVGIIFLWRFLLGDFSQKSYKPSHDL